MAQGLLSAETPVQPENAVAQGTVASRLASRNDAVCDGKNVRLGYTDKTMLGGDGDDSLKITGAEMLAGRLNTEPDAILRLSEKVAALTDPINGKFAGIYINSLGQQSEMSAAATIAVIQYISRPDNVDKPHDQLLKEAYQFVQQTIDGYKNNNGYDKAAFTEAQMAIALVAKDGNVTVINTGGNQVAILGADGKIKGDVIEGQKTTSDLAIKKAQMTTGDRIVLCQEGQVAKLVEEMQKENKVYTVEQMADLLADKETATVAVGEVEKKQAPAAPVKSAEGKTQSERKPTGHRYPYYKDMKSGEALDGVEAKLIRSKTITDPNAEGGRRTVVINYLTEVGTLLDKVKPLAEYSGKSDLDLLNELEKRVRYPGDWQDKGDDEAYKLTKVLPDQEVLLMALEAKRAFLLREDNQKIINEFNQSEGENLHRREVRTAVRHDTIMAEVDGELDKYFGEKGPEKLPQEDLTAFSFVADVLMDVGDSSLGKTAEGKAKTYREAFKKLLTGVKTKPENKQKLLELRRQFYRNAIDALRSRELTVSQTPVRTPQELVLQEMRIRIQTLQHQIAQGTSVEDLRKQYQGVLSGASENTVKKIDGLLRQYPAVMVDMALKGGDLMDRRARYEGPKLHEVPAIIHHKILLQPTLKEFAQGETTGKKPLAAPVGEGGEQTKGKKAEIPAPIITEKPAVMPAPTNKEQPPAIFPAALKGSENVDRDNLVVSLVSDNVRRTQNLVGLAQHGRAEDSEKYPAPTTIAGKLLYPVRHPLRFSKKIWQQAVFRNIFDQQWTRFSVDLTSIVARKAGLYQSIPLDLSQSDFDASLKGGRGLRAGKGVFWKLRTTLGDVVANTLGIGQTSEQHLAKEWMEKQGGELIAQIKERSIEEQTKRGERQALMVKGLTLEQANAQILSSELGETRYDLTKYLPEAAGTQLTLEIKTYIKAYAEERLSKEALLSQLNKYFIETVIPQVNDNRIKKELSGLELASNIITVADKVKADWGYYNTNLSQVKIDILAGKGEWGGVRDKAEVSKTTEILARRLIERQLLRNGVVLTSVNTASWIWVTTKDVAVYAAAYLGGGVLAAGRLGPSVAMKVGSLVVGPISPIGGLLSTAVVAGIREGGIVIPWHGRLYGLKGRYLSEFKQYSRERAAGRENPATANIRNELDRAVVDSKTAKQLVESLTAVLKTEGADSKSIALALAHVKARMRMTDLSSVKKGILGTDIGQHFITFTEGKQNEEMKELNSLILEGVSKLALTDRENWQTILGQAQAVMEAQLRVGSIKEKLAGVIQREQKTTSAEATTMVNQYFSDLQITENKSLEGSMRTLTKLNARRAVSTAAKVTLFAPIAGGAGKIVWGEIADTLHDIGVSRGDVGAGLMKYVDDWHKIIQGNVPVEKTIVGGKISVASDLTFLQKGVLMGRSFLEPPHWPIDQLPLHNEVVDGTSINFSPGLRHDEMPGVGDYLTDTRTGEIYDLSDKQFSSFVGADGKSHIRLLDLTNDKEYVDDQINTLFGGKVDVTAGPNVSSEILSMKGSSIDTSLGHETVIPSGTLPNGEAWHSVWIKDAAGNNDLIAVDEAGVPIKIGGRDAILMNDVRFDAAGRITGSDTDPTHSFASQLKIDETSAVMSGGSKNILSSTGEINPSGNWGMHKTDIIGRDWHNENRLNFYDWKLNGDKVVLDIGSVKSVQGLGDKFGVYVTLADHAKEGIFVPAENINGKLQVIFDPSSTKVIPGSNGMTIGELSNLVINKQAVTTFQSASELTNRADIFNLGIGEKAGYIEAVAMEKTPTGGFLAHVGATITGTHGAILSPPEPPTTIFKQIISGDKLFAETPTFNMYAKPLIIPDLPWIPVYWRDNIERSVPQGKGKPQPGKPVTSKAASPITQPNELAKAIEVDISKMSKHSKKHFEDQVLPALKKYEEVLTGGDKKKIDATKQSLAKALGTQNQLTKKDNPDAAIKTPNELIEQLTIAFTAKAKPAEAPPKEAKVEVETEGKIKKEFQSINQRINEVFKDDKLTEDELSKYGLNPEEVKIVKQGTQDQKNKLKDEIKKRVRAITVLSIVDSRLAEQIKQANDKAFSQLSKEQQQAIQAIEKMTEEERSKLPEDDERIKKYQEAGLQLHKHFQEDTAFQSEYQKAVEEAGKIIDSWESSLTDVKN